MDAFIIGIAIGAIHFGGLWWTIVRLEHSPNPFVVAGLSYLVRMATTVAGFYVFMQGDWVRLVALAGGFTLTRLVLGFHLRHRAQSEPTRTA